MSIDDTGIARSYLPGQLGRDDPSPRGSGKMPLSESVRGLRDADRIVGCRRVGLDRSDDPVSYCGDNGFIRIGKNEREDPNQMAILL